MWPWASYLGIFKQDTTTVKIVLFLEDHFYLDDGLKGKEAAAGKYYQVQAIVHEGLFRLRWHYLGCKTYKWQVENVGCA